MKKLLFLFSVVFIAGFCSAQVTDGTYESGYQSGFYKVAGEYPKVTPVNSQWQNQDQGNANAPAISGENAEYRVNLRAAYSRGYIQGKRDANAAIQSSDNTKSNKVKSKSKARNK